MIKLAFRYEATTISVLLLRLLFSLPFYVAILIWFQRGSKKYVANTQIWFRLLFLSFIGFYISSFLDFYGLNYLPAGLERILIFTTPTIVLLMGFLFFKTKVTGIQIISTVICYIGILVAFVSQENLQGGNNLSLGATLVMGSAVTYALYLILSERILQEIPMVFFTCIVMIFSTVFVAVHFLVVDDINALLSYHPNVYLYGILMAIFATVIPTFMIAEGIKRIGAGNTAILGGIGPISTIVLAALILDEHFSLWQYIGTFLVLAGVYVLSINTKKRKSKSN